METDRALAVGELRAAQECLSDGRQILIVDLALVVRIESWRIGMPDINASALFCSSAQAKRTCVRRRGCPPGQSSKRSSSSFLISPILVAFFRGTGMKSIGPAHRTETEIATSTLLRIAFEYGQIA